MEGGVKEKLAHLDTQSEAMIKAGKYLESLEAMEEALNIRREIYGETSDEYYRTAEKLCELCNMLSMIFLQKEKFDATLEFLKKAEVLGQNSLELRAITFNNLACYYRRIGKLRIALKYLQDALSIESKLEKSQTLADTHLNICAVFSQLGKHEQAKEHIMQSIILLQDEFLGYSMSGSSKNLENEPDKKKAFDDRVAVLAIAYHNLGVEHEYLKQFDEAIATYKKAVAFAKGHLGESSQVVLNLQNVLQTAQNQILDMKAKNQMKKTQKSFASKTGGLAAQNKKTHNVYQAPLGASNKKLGFPTGPAPKGSSNGFDLQQSVSSKNPIRQEEIAEYDSYNDQSNSMSNNPKNIEAFNKNHLSPEFGDSDTGIEEKESHLEQNSQDFPQNLQRNINHED